ncbi:protealysin inhibitor emfourin [Streptosporangium sp. NPDC002544]|uniref:protealysin inhibitor emfourin n=1 Tax=unclassified Streptosporangium TaxID=2632669 RepID=UPI0033250970
MVDDTTLRVRLRCTGGIAGEEINGLLDASHLPADRARELEALVGALPAEDVRGLFPPPVPDSTFYELHVERYGERRAYWYHSGSLPPEVLPLVRLLLHAADGNPST